MDSQIKEKRRDKLKSTNKIQLIKEAKARLDARKLNEIEGWIEEVKKLKVNENTDIDKEEIVLLLHKMFKELMQTATSDETVRVIGHKIQETIQQKRRKIDKLKKQTRKKQKQFNRQLDLKHFEGSIAKKLMDLIAERNVELVKVALDRLWRKTMNGETLIGKDFEAIEAAKSFLREAGSKSS